MIFLLENKLQILLLSEFLGWMLLIPMFYFRHWALNKPLFIVSTVLSGFFGYIPHVAIPIIACMMENSISPLYNSLESVIFLVLLLLIVVFGLTKGKTLVKKIDTCMYEKAQAFKEKTKKNLV